MTEEERAALIAEKQRELQALKKEIDILSGPKDIASLVTEPCRDWAYNLDVREYEPTGFYRSITRTFIWGDLKRIIMRIFSDSHKLKKVADLSTEEKELAAECADAIIRVYNKYFEKANGISEEK